MRVLIFSDSHGETENMISAARIYAPELAIFLGDGLRDFESFCRRFPRLPTESVRGNCDYLSQSPEQRELQLGDLRLLLCHGHRYGVKRDLSLLSRKARSLSADIALFGHTHVACHLQEAGLLLFNPGSVGDPKNPSCGLLELCGRRAEFRHITCFSVGRDVDEFGKML
jgi:putative phosphoesterase